VHLRVSFEDRNGIARLPGLQILDQCLAIANHGYVLEQGRNRLEGPADELLEDPEVVSLYLGVRRTPKASPR
jgi:ABC-type branched-subunit amino acid transport system ATPase component